MLTASSVTSNVLYGASSIALSINYTATSIPRRRYRINLSVTAYVNEEVELNELQDFAMNDVVLCSFRDIMQHELDTDRLGPRVVSIIFDGGLAGVDRVAMCFGGTSCYDATITVLNLYRIIVFGDDRRSIANKPMPSSALLFINHV